MCIRDRVMERKNAVVKRLVDGIHALLKANGVNIIEGEGSFADRTTVKVKTADGERKIISDKYIIATGSVPSTVPIKGIDSPQCIDSTGALSLEKCPESMVVIGLSLIHI